MDETQKETVLLINLSGKFQTWLCLQLTQEMLLSRDVHHSSYGEVLSGSI